MSKRKPNEKRSRRVAALALVLVTAVPALALQESPGTRRASRLRDRAPVTSPSEPFDPTEASLLGSAARQFLHDHGGTWEFRADRRRGRVALVQGSGIPLVPGRGDTLGAGAGVPASGLDVDALEPLARDFLDAQSGLLVPQRGRLVLDREASRVFENGRLASIQYLWQVDGLPVEGARVFVRVNSGNITQFGSALVGPIVLNSRPTVGAAEARELLLVHTGDQETAIPVGQARLQIQPEDGPGDTLRYRLVWSFHYRVFGEIETWEGRVDAHTGEVVLFHDVNRYARAFGGIWPRSVFLGGETSVPLSELDVTVGPTTLTTDAGGRYAYAGGSVASVLDGPFFDVRCTNCISPAQPLATSDLGSGLLDFGSGGLDHVGNGRSTPSDRNTFYNLNRVRRVALSWLPDLSWLQTTVVSNTNISSTCNAFYNGTVNFFRSGGGCNNTGEIADVIFHEWGHGLDHHTLVGDGSTGEGTADVVSMHLTHSPLVGPGFRVNGEPVRDLDKTTSPLGTMTFGFVLAGGCNTPGGLSPHCGGQVYGQTAWDLSQALVGKYGHHTGWRTSERLFFTSLPDARSLDPGDSLSIYAAYVQADDTDGNLTNGIPNAQELYAAFATHEIEVGSMPLPTSPLCTRPAQPQLVVVPNCGELELSWTSSPGAVRYEVLRADLSEDTAYVPIAAVDPPQTTYVDTLVAPGADYWYTVLAVGAGDCESTIEDPQHARLTAPILELTARLADDTPAGNRSGFPDPGEDVDLVLTLSNLGSATSVGIGGTVEALTPGVTLLDSSAAWPDLAPGASASNTDPVRFRAETGPTACGDTLDFQLTSNAGGGCPSDVSFFRVAVGQDDGQGGFVCDPTPACFVDPSFAGLATATAGASCAEVDLAWPQATSHCTNATIRYNVYRSTSAGFVPGPATLHRESLASTTFSDSLLALGQAYHYVVRAVDSRSGEDSNLIARSATPPAGPDLQPPVFSGLASATTGEACGATLLEWDAGVEPCSLPVVYEIHRGGDPSFVPSPLTLVGTTYSTSFADAALPPGENVAYVVRARDAAGNADSNPTTRSVVTGAADLVLFEQPFESGPAGWALGSINNATDGIWQWGDPEGTAFQPDDDATPGGVACWITGLAQNASNGDVDNGMTTLVSERYSLVGATAPAVRFARWFTNDRGSNPGEASDAFQVEVSNNDGASWSLIDTVGAGTPLAWVEVQTPIPSEVPPTATMRFRFKAADLGTPSLVEAGIDDFALVDVGQGCAGCPRDVPEVGVVLVRRQGDDIVLDWSADPVSAPSFVVYAVVAPVDEGADVGMRLGSTAARTFVHEAAALSVETFLYRVTAVDACGEESALDAD